MSFTNDFKETVLSQYKDGKSQMQLEREYLVSRTTILKWINEARIEEHWFKAKYLDKNLVIKMYTDGLSVLKIAEELSVGRRPIESILNQNGIDKRDNSTALMGRYGSEKNPNYKGGNARDLIKKDIPKLSRVLDVWAKIIISLDNFECKLCGENKGFIDAHHIIPVRTIYREKLDYKLLMTIDNGIAICRKCHLLFHMKEKSFEGRLKKLIKNRINSVDTLQDYLFSLLQDNTEPSMSLKDS